MQYLGMNILGSCQVGALSSSLLCKLIFKCKAMGFIVTFSYMSFYSYFIFVLALCYFLR